MRVVVQRVNHASVISDAHGKATIGKGLMILLGIEHDDASGDIEWLVGKLLRLRIFDDEAGVMNLSVSDISGELMVVSQFTLHASTRKGNRPSYIKAAPPEISIPLYEAFVARLKSDSGLKVETGWFGANMKILLENDGPVTIVMDSKGRE
ncbi:MAG: D-aminoacyl-tRNA deacylase [Lentimicrobium sp.]|jgi:D-tyrosyl-tRNA(Tyr) deacylase|nr:D-aminoacyl-tRNA deacylase [Lentimicrobium sp.]